jgi:hypothetical protein
MTLDLAHKRVNWQKEGEGGEKRFTSEAIRAILVSGIMEHDLNLWGIFAVPVGVLLCFGPALIVWIRQELQSPPSEDPKTKR